ncbi:hypothetical protein [Candidatus Accumulibacter vicinus]|uniref:Secreted protein n=1 Tax=Candidatus Accumulibacter vicinus TaxID=2954382 RepID=A0A084Y4S6_9PROT|nr:hypothetical protein [Candidatus Accumulibacter vicinus]KFB69720.1 MAG: hypothetical protein CAPSK01_000554 [Candidatus Accumulibacter vicinus]
MAASKQMAFHIGSSVLIAVFGVFLAVASGTAAAQSCHPAPLQSDPGSASSGASLVRLAGDYKLRETGSRTIRLQAGQSYWFAASGCPRTDDIELTVTAPDGATILSRVGHTTAGCVKPPKSGNYRIAVKPLSLRSGYDWGSIAAEGAKSSCDPSSG